MTAAARPRLDAIAAGRIVLDAGHEGAGLTGAMARAPLNGVMAK